MFYKSHWKIIEAAQIERDFFAQTGDGPEHAYFRSSVHSTLEVCDYDVVQKIEKCKTDANDRPVSEQKILKAYVK